MSQERYQYLLEEVMEGMSKRVPTLQFKVGGFAMNIAESIARHLYDLEQKEANAAVLLPVCKLPE